MAKDFYTAIEERRSRYSITNESTISDEKIQNIIKYALKHTPFAFNAHSGRAILLLENDHNKLWDITKEELKKIVPEENFKDTNDKINSFKNGYGTILFFEDSKIVKSLQKEYPLYKDNFPKWSLQSLGMLQYNIWTSLSIEGLGATLQHYSEVIENRVKKEWEIPSNWKMIAQMPFGKPANEPPEKEFADIDKFFKLYD